MNRLVGEALDEMAKKEKDYYKDLTNEIWTSDLNWDFPKLEPDFYNARELTTELTIDQIDILVQYMNDIRELKDETKKHTEKYSYQHLINDATGELLELEEKLNKLMSEE